ncbi:sugar ABC transporter substrate-binding protein [Actinomadura mexicana]|uniref:Monosaccharide ABC transporter substrate-binding protein, CUT2 family n=1 Tax=Actinomadura mexicana TaxID=134959 RepID=A0A239FA03_9ACTN|nr:sugar ABC transporter substrate-binding protein [Actinomadura mexicana]SNS53571.1 monosaccharide ABC transporter substrate-binding protein, CUT2 family [Actinomadura mexicana]
MERIDPAVEEAVDDLGLSEPTRRRLLSGAGLVSATAAASALLAACSSDNKSSSSPTGGPGHFPKTPNWKFVFVNHVTTNPFFTPTQYGAQDACALLGCSFQWTGSQNSAVPEMVSATNAAISGKADGLAVAVVDKTAFRQPVDKALDAGIPVVSYNADGAKDDPGTNRLAYIGQDLYTSGYQLGTKIAALMTGGDAVGFIATPGSLNIQPRIDGARDAIKASGKPIKFTSVASGAELPKELSTVDAYAQGHQNVKGMFAVDAGSTESIGKVMQKYRLKGRGVAAGGFDLTPGTLGAVKSGDLDFTIDQQPYLQGFLPVLALWFYKLSGGLVFPPVTNTGLTFVSKQTVGPYLTTKTRYEGSSPAQQLVPRSGAIAHV